MPPPLGGTADAVAPSLESLECALACLARGLLGQRAEGCFLNMIALLVHGQRCRADRPRLSRSGAPTSKLSGQTYFNTYKW